MPNRTDRRGRGFAPKAIHVAAEDGAAVRELLTQRHGYSAEEAIAGLVSGELKTVLMDNAQLWNLLRWLEAQQSDDPIVSDAIRSLVHQLS